MSVDSDTIEHMFDTVPLTLGTSHPVASRQATLGALRQQLRRLEPGQLSPAPIPVLPVVENLFPEGGLKPGAVYCLPSHTSVMWALIAHATQRDHWVASVGNDHLGFSAAIDYGVSIDRVLVVPRTGSWWQVVSAFVDVVSVVVFHPHGPLPSPTSRDALLARARERGVAILVRGDWPHPHARIGVEATRWSGLGQGDGVLTSQDLTLSYHPRHGSGVRRVTLMRDGSGVRVADDQLTPVRHLTPRTPEAPTIAVSDHREAG